MATDDNKDDPSDEISFLLNKFYKPSENLDNEDFWNSLNKKIDSLYHKEIYSDNNFDNDKNLLNDEQRYWLGMEEYINNQISSLRHKTVTDHLLKCKECRLNYNQLLDKKKPIESEIVKNQCLYSYVIASQMPVTGGS